MRYTALLSASAGVAFSRVLYQDYSFDPLQHLAGIAPYFEPSDPPKDPSVPQGCNVTKAAYLSRHAAIDSNDFDLESYLDPLLEKLGNNTGVDWSRIPALAFLSDWIAPQLTESEQLTRSGKLEAVQLGTTLSFKYSNLRLPKRVWASTAERTVKSAQSLIRGLEIEDDTINLVQIYEGKQSGADSLTPYSSCPQYSSSFGSKQSGQFQQTYTAPIIARLNALAPSFNFTATDIYGMQEMCGYETVIRGSSPFCDLDLFGPDDWLGFEYTNDIMYHYNTGYGNPISGVIGFPWVNATMNLLSSDTAQDQDLYISLTHRELPPTVLVALGLFNNTEFTSDAYTNASMPLDRINYNRAWVSSYILPFLSNIVIEKMDCSNNYYVQSQASNSSGNAIYYRVVVNNSPQVLPGCNDGPNESCSSAGLQQFMSERAAMFGGYSQKCNVTYSNSTDTVSFYTSSDNGTTVGK